MGKPEGWLAPRKSRDLSGVSSRTPEPGESSSDAGISGNAPSRQGPALPGSEPTLLDLDATMADRQAGASARRATGVEDGISASAPILRVGDVLGSRYEILQLLGEGGMGSVYKARDRELDRVLALKLIRPDLSLNSAILARFKQELLLAHQVTHKNVVRIYDFAEADGVKFITMEFIEGVDLRKLLATHGKFSPAETIAVVRQICLALEAAHGVGVIHRDLKPQNIMRDNTGRIVVMDFGLARTVDSVGMTRTGMLVGTLEYMSPEQAMGLALDHRSDIFALGLIFFELLTAQSPYEADSAIASLLKRSHERAIPAVDVDPTIPRGLSDVVSKCLERDLNLRYQNVQEILSDLEGWEGKHHVSASSTRAALARRLSVFRFKYAVAAILFLAVALGVWSIRGRFTGKKQSVVTRAPVVSLAVMPFQNSSGDSSLDWLGSSMAEMLTTEIGQSASLRTVSSDRVHQILNDLRMAGNVEFTPESLHQISDLSNSDMVITGQYARFGDQIRIDASLQDLKHDRPAIRIRSEANNVKEVPPAIDRLAESMRNSLSLSPELTRELLAQSFRPSSESMEALRLYDEGRKLWRDGNNLEAVKRFQGAVALDSQFALAYAKLGETYAALGRDAEAEEASRKAEDLSSNLPAPERYLILATHARLANDNQKAIDYYQQLAKASPEDTDIQFALGNLYDNVGSYDLARQQYNRALERDPQSIDVLLAMGRMLTRTGDPQAGLKYLNTGYLLAVQGNNVGKKAASLQATGLAYEGLSKMDDALRNLQESLSIRRQIGDQRGAAGSLSELGVVFSQLGQTKNAEASFLEALKIRREIGDKRGLGATLLDYGNFVDDQGDHDKALKLYTESLQIQRDTNNASREAMCLNNIGSVHFSKGEYEDALTYFQQAVQLREKANAPRDVVESINNVAETFVMMGRYSEAISQYMKALDLRRTMGDKRGAAIESYSIGTVFEYQGRFGAAVNSKNDALKVFQELKDGTFWMAEILSGYGKSLVLSGRGDEAAIYLDQALTLARQLKNNGLVAQTLGYQADALFYKGEVNSARPLYERALQAASEAKEPDKILIAKINLARQNLYEGHGAAALSSLRALSAEAERQGLKYRVIECSIYVGQVLMDTKSIEAARAELEHALMQSEKLGLNPLSFQAHYILATLLRQSGKVPDAQEHYRRALRLTDEMAKEPGAEKLLNRSDLSKAVADCNRWLQTS